jgi:polar amino acid transport system substrate-binding protein
VAPERLAVRAGDPHAPRSPGELKGLKIGTLPSTLAQKILERAGAEVKAYDGGQETLYADLVGKRTDGVLIDEPVSTYYGAVQSELQIIDASFGEVRYAIATAKGQTALRDTIDDALDDLGRTGKLREIYERWGLWNGETAGLLHDSNVPSHGSHEAYEAWRSASHRGTLLERLATYPKYWRQFLAGAEVTLGVSLLAFALAVSLGVTLALMRRYGPLPLRWLAVAYIEVFRGTPLLVQLFFIYYGLPELQINLSPLEAGVLGLGFNYAAAEAENYRAGLESVPAGQMEASWALGLSTWQAVRYVVVPQAIRVAIPPATNDFIALLKDSSLVSVITMSDLLRESQTLASSTRDSRGIFLICGAIYLLLGLPFSRLARYAEQRMSAHLRRVET